MRCCRRVAGASVAGPWPRKRMPDRTCFGAWPDRCDQAVMQRGQGLATAARAVNGTQKRKEARKRTRGLIRFSVAGHDQYRRPPTKRKPPPVGTGGGRQTNQITHEEYSR